MLKTANFQRNDVAEDIVRTLDSFESPVASAENCDNNYSISLETSEIPLSYVREWETYFTNSSSLPLKEHLRQLFLAGNLKNCHFRSLCWRIFMDILSQSTNEWEKEISSLRNNYIQLRKKYLIDPYMSNPPNSTVCNDDDPLSLNEQSIWNKYFRYKDIRREILQDVIRTFPELQFFHDESIRQSMVNILLCYSAISPLGYKQGMHEILAPILFVLHCDFTAFQHVSELSSFPASMSNRLVILLDANYLEHDAFAMFSGIMFRIGSWFAADRTHSSSQLASSSDKKPFDSDFDNAHGSCPVLSKLHYIHETLLKDTDRELYNYLKAIDISPQMYGLRWLRLLFGREYPLQDLLVIWDAIFAIQDNFILVDYIFLSMLHLLRQLLLRCDFSKALGSLLHYPHVMGVDSKVVKQALYLYKPHEFAKPMEEFISLPRMSSFDEMNSSSRSKNNYRSDNWTLRWASEMLPKISPFGMSQRDGPPALTGGKSPEKRRQSTSRATKQRQASLKSTHSSADYVEICLPNELVAKSEMLHNYHEMNDSCSQLLNLCVIHLQRMLLDDQSCSGLTTNEKKKLDFSVAAMKHMRDMLKGDIPFDKSLLDKLSANLTVEDNLPHNGMIRANLVDIELGELPHS